MARSKLPYYLKRTGKYDKERLVACSFRMATLEHAEQVARSLTELSNQTHVVFKDDCPLIKFQRGPSLYPGTGAYRPIERIDLRRA